MSDEEASSPQPEAPKRKVRTPGAAQPVVASEASSPQPEESSLPNAIDIDATKITSNVLTRQGWVCPDPASQPPARR